MKRLAEAAIKVPPYFFRGAIENVLTAKVVSPSLG
jgi:hypothetical protein